ncbi:hypothetical protein [Risungbinella massiliensis]|uniref:hypothetical protein n=1 Tax=Risungbinella massiliensis TaxID=1329796 RepID=UPI0005CC1744|nr:hypothetical protein [Risungbinella massiliensis]
MSRQAGFYYPILLGFVSLILFILLAQLSELQQRRELEWWERERSEVTNAAESALASWLMQGGPTSSEGSIKQSWDRFSVEIQWNQEASGNTIIQVTAFGERKVQKSLVYRYVLTAHPK